MYLWLLQMKEKFIKSCSGLGTATASQLYLTSSTLLRANQFRYMKNKLHFNTRFSRMNVIKIEAEILTLMTKIFSSTATQTSTRFFVITLTLKICSYIFSYRRCNNYLKLFKWNIWLKLWNTTLFHLFILYSMRIR